MRITERRLRSIIRSIIKEGYEEDMKLVLHDDMTEDDLHELVDKGFGRQLAIDYLKKHENEIDFSKFTKNSRFNDDMHDPANINKVITNKLVDICSERCSAFEKAIYGGGGHIYRKFRRNVKRGVEDVMSGDNSDLLNLGK